MFWSDADLCVAMPGREVAPGVVQGDGDVPRACCCKMSCERQRRGGRCSRAIMSLL